MNAKLRRPGFTIVELLVSLAVVGLIFALLLPAVLSVHARHRLVRCKNHLHQIALAAHNYESQFGVYPNKNPNQISGILANSLCCPADSLESYWMGAATSTPVSCYHLDYGACSVPLPQVDGFATDRADLYRSARDITDGLSSTVAYGERLLPPTYHGIVGFDATAFQSDWIRFQLRFPSQAVLNSRDSVASECRLHGRPDNPVDWSETLVSMTHVLPPNSNSCYHDEYAPITISSQHTGGATAAFVGGSVTLISENVDLSVWRSLGTRSGHEPIGDF